MSLLSLLSSEKNTAVDNSLCCLKKQGAVDKEKQVAAAADGIMTSDSAPTLHHTLQQPTDMKETAILLDNQDLTRIGIISMIQTAAPDTATVEVATRQQLGEQLRKTPDALVVLDFINSDITDSEILVRLADIYNKVQWLVISDDISDAMARRLSCFAAFGMVLKGNRREEIASAISLALNGERYICQHIMNLLLSPASATQSLIDDLTPTEVEVLRRIALGKTVKEIAAERNSSAHTITTHKRSIFRKLHVNTSYEATRMAIKTGLVELVEYYI